MAESDVTGVRAHGNVSLTSEKGMNGQYPIESRLTVCGASIAVPVSRNRLVGRCGKRDLPRRLVGEIGQRGKLLPGHLDDGSPDRQMNTPLRANRDRYKPVHC